MLSKNPNCINCKCNTCVFTLHQGDHTDCWNCEACNKDKGEMKQTSCTGYKNWEDIRKGLSS